MGNWVFSRVYEGKVILFNTFAMAEMRQQYQSFWLISQVFLCALLVGCRQEKPAADGRVVAVKDGDTIEVMELGKAQTVRLAEVDAPEKNQDFGTQAKKYTSDLAFGKEVRLRRHETDRYGRLVATVILPDGRSLNEELVKNGYAWHYKAYSRNPQLASLEADAREYRRGLWSIPNPIAPWEFRKNRRAGNLNSPQNQVQTNAGAQKLSPETPVWICSSKTVKFFHVRGNCPRLRRCGKEILQMAKAQAEGQGKGKLCSECGG